MPCLILKALDFIDIKIGIRTEQRTETCLQWNEFTLIIWGTEAFLRGVCLSSLSLSHLPTIGWTQAALFPLCSWPPSPCPPSETPSPTWVFLTSDIYLEWLRAWKVTGKSHKTPSTEKRGNGAEGYMSWVLWCSPLLAGEQNQVLRVESNLFKLNGKTDH